MAIDPLLGCGPADLLDRAIETLRARLLPHAAETPDRDAALSALRALAIVRAQLVGDPSVIGREVAEIEGLLGHDFQGDALAARRALAAAIRARSLPVDGPAEVRLRDHLLRAAAHRLRLTNPKYMTRRQRRGGILLLERVRGRLAIVGLWRGSRRPKWPPWQLRAGLGY